MDTTKDPAPRPVADIRKCLEYGHRWGDWANWNIPNKPTFTYPACLLPPAARKPLTKAYRFRECLECNAFAREDFQGNNAIFEPGLDPFEDVGFQ